MTVKVNVWRPELTSMTEDVLKPTFFKVKKDLLMSDFINLISAEFKIAQQSVMVLKRNPMLNLRQMEVLSNEPTKALNVLRINEGVNLFVEDTSVPIPEKLKKFSGLEFDEPKIMTTEPETEIVTKWEKEFELESNRFQVKFNNPNETASVSKEENSGLNPHEVAVSKNSIYKNYLVVDRRISVLDLKIEIGKFFNLDLDSIVFRRGGSHGTELLEDDLSLK